MIATQPEVSGVPTTDSKAALQRAAELLSLMAAPTFAVMALVTDVSGGRATDMFCSLTPGGFSGMVPMYLLMSLFHAGAWLTLLSRRRTN